MTIDARVHELAGVRRTGGESSPRVITSGVTRVAVRRSPERPGADNPGTCRRRGPARRLYRGPTDGTMFLNRSYNSGRTFAVSPDLPQIQSTPVVSITPADYCRLALKQFPSRMKRSGSVSKTACREPDELSLVPDKIADDARISITKSTWGNFIP